MDISSRYEQARAALELCGLEATPARIAFLLDDEGPHTRIAPVTVGPVPPGVRDVFTTARA